MVKIIPKLIFFLSSILQIKKKIWAKKKKLILVYQLKELLSFFINFWQIWISFWLESCLAIKMNLSSDEFSLQVESTLDYNENIEIEDIINFKNNAKFLF